MTSACIGQEGAPVDDGIEEIASDPNDGKHNGADRQQDAHAIQSIGRRQAFDEDKQTQEQRQNHASCPMEDGTTQASSQKTQQPSVFSFLLGFPTHNHSYQNFQA